MTTYFTTDPTARVSFWDSKVEHTVTKDGLTVGGLCETADRLVEQGLLKVGDPHAKTRDALVYDPEADESLAYARAHDAELEQQAPPTAAAQEVPEASASSESDETASAPSGHDAHTKGKRT